MNQSIWNGTCSNIPSAARENSIFLARNTVCASVHIQDTRWLEILYINSFVAICLLAEAGSKLVDSGSVCPTDEACRWCSVAPDLPSNRIAVGCTEPCRAATLSRHLFSHLPGRRTDRIAFSDAVELSITGAEPSRVEHSVESSTVAQSRMEWSGVESIDVHVSQWFHCNCTYTPCSY